MHSRTVAQYAFLCAIFTLSQSLLALYFSWKQRDSRKVGKGSDRPPQISWFFPLEGHSPPGMPQGCVGRNSWRSRSLLAGAALCGQSTGQWPSPATVSSLLQISAGHSCASVHSRDKDHPEREAGPSLQASAFAGLLPLSLTRLSLSSSPTVGFSLSPRKTSSSPQVSLSFAGLHACVLSLLSYVWLFATPWTVSCQALLSMGFPRQEYWSELPFPSLGPLPNPMVEPESPTLAADSLPSEPLGKPLVELENRTNICLL